jgi:hypothetical protein
MPRGLVNGGARRMAQIANSGFSPLVIATGYSGRRSGAIGESSEESLKNE